LSFNGEKAFEYLEKLSVDIGTRPSGTDEERKSAEWILSELKKLGLDAWIEEFDAFTGKVTAQKLEVTEPFNREIKCEVMPLSGSTSPNGVTGDIIHLDSYDEEYITEDVKGKIIVTSGSPANRHRAYAQLKKFPPAGIVIVESTPRAMAKNLWGSPTYRKKYVDIPMVRITFEDGVDLLKSEAKTMRLTAVTEEKTVKTQNVVAEVKGTLRPEEIILVGGHYDTVLEVPGAGDNAGGTAITLELARVFKEKGTKRTMRFIAWGCEELGLLGSREYAKRLRETSEEAKKKDEDAVTELDNTVLCINLDVHGGLIGTNSSRVLGPPELTAAVKLLSKEKGVVFNVSEGVYSSDGTPLSAVGVPSVSLSRNTPTNRLMHSREDEIKWLSPEVLGKHGVFAEEFLTRYVADAAAWPFERTIPEKQKKEIEEYFKKAGRKLP
jgi:acetylornithine deacetylase/succinyl-diaminopimelate desuccinylase-like protein